LLKTNFYKSIGASSDKEKGTITFKNVCLTNNPDPELNVKSDPEKKINYGSETLLSLMTSANNFCS
jgi:hypothetical protein